MGLDDLTEEEHEGYREIRRAVLAMIMIIEDSVDRDVSNDEMAERLSEFISNTNVPSRFIALEAVGLVYEVLKQAAKDPDTILLSLTEWVDQ